MGNRRGWTISISSIPDDIGTTQVNCAIIRDGCERGSEIEGRKSSKRMLLDLERQNTTGAVLLGRKARLLLDEPRFRVVADMSCLIIPERGQHTMHKAEISLSKFGVETLEFLIGCSFTSPPFPLWLRSQLSPSWGGLPIYDQYGGLRLDRRRWRPVHCLRGLEARFGSVSVAARPQSLKWTLRPLPSSFGGLCVVDQQEAPSWVILIFFWRTPNQLPVLSHRHSKNRSFPLAHSNCTHTCRSCL